MRISSGLWLPLLFLALTAYACPGLPAAWAQQPFVQTLGPPPPESEPPKSPEDARRRVQVYQVGDLLTFESPQRSIAMPGGGIVAVPAYATPYSPSPYPVAPATAPPASYPPPYPAPPSYPSTSNPPLTLAPRNSSLERLAGIVREMLGDAPIQVTTHPDTQSLVIRANDEGHREVQELLEGLREAGRPTIRIEMQRLFPSGIDRAKLEPEQTEALERSFHKSPLTEEEVEAIRELDRDAWPPLTLELVSGRPVTVAEALYQGRIVAAAEPGSRSIRVRLEYAVSEAHLEQTGQPQTRTIPVGHSAIIVRYGEQAIWLLTPSFIEEATEEPSVDDTLLRNIPYSKKLFRNVGVTRDGVEQGLPLGDTD